MNRRRVRYQVATSLDGFIADSQDGYSWIREEPDFDFKALFAQFDTLLMGRRTYEAVTDQLASFAGKQILVFSRRLDPADHPGVRVVREEATGVVAELKAREEGSDIWLYGGGVLFRSLLQAGLVDTVEPAVIPVLLGEGRRMLPSAPGPWTLRLENSRAYEHSGMVLLEYRVDYGIQDRPPLSKALEDSFGGGDQLDLDGEEYVERMRRGMARRLEREGS